ncbi:CREB-regulated transcription coactivator 1-like isoform X2 [Tachypleus tridentatus]|uniref:CREB-regulated transcription coactivator 1-like isoform X2 n=1 Tax=Tachypleus tridentatus TaxID=6853 RepID=UPI003FD025B3
MANPRKFSEKIALHNQKQAEETAAFDQVMREVMGATRSQHLHLCPSLGSYRGGSLPNVNHIGNNSIDLQSALISLEDMKQGRDHSDRTHREQGRQGSPHRTRQFPFQKRTDVSTYGLVAYLSPPTDTNWRRTSSDSALHQSASNSQENSYILNTSPVRRIHDVHSGVMHNTCNNHLKENWDIGKPPQQQGCSPLSPHTRPNSCEVPNTGTYLYQEESNLIYVPISNNTGSLPDLTNLHFPSPLATSVDVEDQSGLFYNQLSLSQSNIVSYTHQVPLTPQQQHTHVIGPSVHGSGLVQSAARMDCGGSRHNSPGPSPSPSSQHRYHHNSSNLVIGSSNIRHHGLHSSKQQQKVCYTPPRYETPQFTVEPSFSVYHQQQSNQSSHHDYVENQAHSQIPYHTNSSSGQSYSDPTSAVSPGLQHGSSLTKSPITDTNYLLYQQHRSREATVVPQLQFGQNHTMGEDLDQSYKFVMHLPDSSGPVSSSNISLPNVHHLNRDTENGSRPQVSVELGTSEGNGYHYSNVQTQPLSMPQDGVDVSLMYYGIPSKGSEPNLYSPPSYSPQTPQTPTIILTGPGADEPLLMQDFVKDIGSAMASVSGFFGTDFITSDDVLRAGLEPIDFDGLQILMDPDICVISDPVTEETFRLEHS